MRGLAVDQPDQELGPRFQEPFATADYLGGDRDLVECLHVHEDVAGGILVKELVSAGLQLGLLEPVRLVEGPLDDVAGLHVAQLGLEHGPALRVELLSISATETVLLLVFHHIIADLWSMDILLQDLREAYKVETVPGVFTQPGMPPQAGPPQSLARSY